MMKKTLTINTVSEKIKPILHQDQKIQAAYLLGSIVHGNFHPHSDIDLAILPIVPKSYSTLPILMLASRLEDE
jgi:predicted nucleotidyltransferase